MGGRGHAGYYFLHMGTGAPHDTPWFREEDHYSYERIGDTKEDEEDARVLGERILRHSGRFRGNDGVYGEW